MTVLPVFDGHNDFLSRLQADPARRAEIFLTGEGKGHLDLPRMQGAGFAGGMFAIWVRSQSGLDAASKREIRQHPPYDIALPPEIAFADALPVALSQAGHLLWMERASDGALKICRTAAEVRETIAAGRIAAVMHMEGAEAISPGLDELYSFHAMGLRSLGPVWSRPTAFGHGVPFRFPGDPDTGEGLTATGKDLVRACDKLRILIDLSHLNAKGFRDVMAISDAPLIATHSNAWEVCRSTRNLTDWQLAAIRESDGMVGLNFAAFFLRPDGIEDPEMSWEPMLRHLDHLIGHLGEDRIGFGSDFDGAILPNMIGDVTGLPRFIAALSQHGYDAALLRKLAHGNWLVALERVWGQ